MTDRQRKAFREAVRQAQLGDWLNDYRGTWIEKLDRDLNPQQPERPLLANNKKG